MLENKRVKSKERKQPEPDSKGTDSTEYNETELSLFDKLSADDLRQPPASDYDSPVKETIITQVEVHFDAEVVDEQPRLELVEDYHGQSKRRKSVKKRKHSRDHEHDHKKKRHSTSKKHEGSEENAITQESPPNPPRIPTAPPPPPLPTAPPRIPTAPPLPPLPYRNNH